MSEEIIRFNRFGFAEQEDMVELSRTVDLAELASILDRVIQIVLRDDPGLLDDLSDSAQADFAVPLGMAGRLLSSGDYSPIELVSAACMVRYSGEPHLSEFPRDLADLVTRLPR